MPFCAPTTESGTNPDLAALAYVTGPLGRFCLPSAATALQNAGSRLASAAGLYHFTSFANGTKQAASQVNIGPAYLALDANGLPYDSNGDGIPDFLADRNGDAAETGEMPWQSPNTGSPAVLFPGDGATVSGTVSLAIHLGPTPSRVTRVVPVVDGRTLPGMTGVSNPGRSSASVEIDTTRLANGAHDVSLRLYATVAAAPSPDL